MGTSDTLRSLIDAGRSSKRLDELSSARVIGKIALQIHAAQQKAGAGKAVGPVTPAHVKLSPSGEATLALEGGSTLGYSSPEQLDGGSGDRRSDVFSLGAVLWEALTYTRLFDAMNDAAVKAAVKERAITPPAEINANVPAELSAICMRALSRNPADRYQSVKAMAVEIEEFLEGAGYEDSDAKIAKHLEALRAAPAAEKHAAGTQPPANVVKQPAAPVLPRDSQPRAKTPSGAAIAAALANAGASSTTSAANATGGASASLAEASLPRAQPAVTAVGVPKLADWQDASAPAHAPPPSAAPVVSVENAEPASAASVPAVPLPPVLPSSSASLPNSRSTIAASAPPPPATTPAAETPENAKATLVDSKPPEVEVPKLVDGKLPEAASARAPSQSDATRGRAPSQSDASPHPAAAVSLGPIPGGRDSKDVLAGWGWGTDKHDAITEGYDGDELYESAKARSRKTLTYMIGGGMALAALVTIVALAFGGSSDKKNTKAVAKQTETSRPAIDQHAPPTDQPGAVEPAAVQPASGAVAEGSAMAAEGSASADGTAMSDGSAGTIEGSVAEDEAARAAAEQAEADRVAAEQAEVDRVAAEKAEADRIAAENAEAKKAEAARIAAEKEAKKAEAARLAAEKAEAKKAEAARLAAERKAKKEEAARVAAERAQAKKAAQANAAKTPRKTEPRTVARAEPNVDAQAAYRTGLQKFARGDTSGALASLRKALAANPSYAPTWRGLGLVFEKMGEKAQARAAFKRYLQLSPGASDAAQIRARLERLGS